MPSAQHQAIVDQWLNNVAPEDPTLEEMRDNYDQLLLPFAPVPDTTFETVNADGINVDFVTAPEADPDRCVVFIHGGGFVLGSVRAYHEFASRISAATGSRVALIDYRLAPEAVAPAARDDCIAAYRWLIEHGADPARTSFIGDSAGGGLALLVAAQLSQSEIPTPAAVVALSPWIDIAVRADMPDPEQVGDPMLTPEFLRWLGQTYLATIPGNDPAHNALHADLAGMPPILVQTGTRDITHMEAVLFADRARAAGVDVELDVYPDLIHDWHAYGPDVPEGREALTRACAFLAKYVGGHQLAPTITHEAG
jgi:monoterpene epsilon-lactone hydrolase